jgi:hypothetical protein
VWISFPIDRDAPKARPIYFYHSITLTYSGPQI